MSRDLTCQMCFYRAKSKRNLICHCLKKHKFDGNFIAYCNVDQCMYSSKSWNAFKIHCRRKHPELKVTESINLDSNNDLPYDRGSDNDNHTGYEDLDDDDSVNQGQQIPVGPGNRNMSKNYFFLLSKHFLSLETEHKVSKSSIDTICGSFTMLMETVMSTCVSKIKDILSLNDLNAENQDEIIQDFREQIQAEILLPCTLFSTDHSRLKMYKQHCSLLSPQPVFMGHRVQRKKGKLARVKHYGYHIPVENMIEKLLNMPEIWHYFKNPRVSTDGIMRDICDGSLVKNSPLNADPGNFLKVSLYYDDVEIQNPLRSSAKYKLAMFYMQILNIPVEFRSKLSNIFLFAICKSKYISQFGLHNVLNDFIETMCKLNGDGLKVVVNGVETVVKGGLLYCLSDTPAAGVIGGYKEGAAFAHRPCRRCYADKTSMKQHFTQDKFELRTMDRHLAECADLVDNTKSRANKAFWSRTFGVNKLSPLCKIKGFDLTKYLLMDTMHILSEGITGHLLALFLHKCIFELELFTLQWLNEQIRSYDYENEMKGHIPEEISKHQLTVDITVKQKAVSMNSLLFILPHIVGPFYPGDNEHYRHFITYVQINQIAFSPYAIAETAVLLENLIEQFCSRWARLYPMANFRPKMHFLVHLPEELKEVGSLRGVSCLRPEAKHGWFKSIPIRNYKNLSFSFAQKHQLHMCHKMLDMNGQVSPNFIYRGDEIGEGSLIKVTKNNVQLYPLLSREIGAKEEYIIYETNKVNIRGLSYDIGKVVVVETDELGHPTFGQIESILVENEIKYFFVNIVQAEYFVWQYNSYLVNNTNNYELIRWADLKNRFVLSRHFIEGKKYVMNLFSAFPGI